MLPQQYHAIFDKNLKYHDKVNINFTSSSLFTIKLYQSIFLIEFNCIKTTGRKSFKLQRNWFYHHWW